MSPPSRKSSRRRQAVHAVVELAGLFVPEDATLANEVELAATDSLTYAKSFRQRMALRIIDSDEPDLPWLALVDGLIDRGRLVEFDWKEDPAAVIRQLDPLLKSRVASWSWSWLKRLSTWQELPTDKLLMRIGDQLPSHGQALFCVDISSDCYPTIVCRSDIEDRATHLSKKAGFGEIFRFGSVK